MIEANLPNLSVGKQCALLSISRSSFYYEPKGESEKRSLMIGKKELRLQSNSHFFRMIFAPT